MALDKYTIIMVILSLPAIAIGATWIWYRIRK